MTRACHTAVRMATGKVFSDEEIDDFLDRLAQRAKRAGKAAPDLDERAAIAQAAGALTRDEIMKAMIEKRMKLARQVADLNRKRVIEAMPAAMNEAKRLSAYDVGAERQGQGVSASTDARGRARQMQLFGVVDLGLSAVPGLKDRISNFWGVSERGLDRKTAAEIARLRGAPGVEPTGDAGALHAAQIFIRAQDLARKMQNDMGAWIADLPGYIGRQTHNAEKISGGMWRELGGLAKAPGFGKLDWEAAQMAAARRAFRAWRDFILPRLDDKTFEGLTEEDVPFEKWQDDAEEKAQLGRQSQLEDARGLAMRGVIDDPTDLRERMLYRTWFDIVTGRRETLTGADDHADFRPPASKAASVSKARVFHYKTADAWMDYNAKYGQGGLFSTMINDLGRSARNAELMHRWGPNPELSRQDEINRLWSEAQARGDTKSAQALTNARHNAEWEALNGRLNTPDNMRLAQTMRTIRSYEALTKLGSIVLSKATDLPMAGQTMARAGAGYLAGYSGALKGILRLSSAEARHAGEALYAGARSASGHLGGQFLATDGAPGWTTWATRLMYKLNGFDFVTEGVRKGVAEAYSSHLGQQVGKPLAALDAGTRETFERFGITAKDWDLVRKGIAPASDGKTYFTLDHLDTLPRKPVGPNTPENGKANQLARDHNAAIDGLHLKFLTLIHNVLDDSVSEPRMREQVTGTFNGAKAGTLWGEIARSFFQFKGFINTIVGRHMIPAAQGFAGYKPVATMGHFIIASALAGWLSMNAKMIAAGKDPRGLWGGQDVGPDGQTHPVADTAKIWSAAMAQGGGFGMYGDFLFGEQARSGKSFSFAAMGGPMISDAEQVAQIVQQAVTGAGMNEKTGRSVLPAEAIRLAKSNIPLVNLWYTRLALDYFVLDGLQEAASPGYLRRYQARSEREGTHFWAPPTGAWGASPN